ncbi:hypothetical protein GCM10022261_00410 [Brevibacterium daeguense]|uniref:Uncharacterized protein n=1 Tax=Brevibacterium daeguense TaxID=909936 RepID=A0ABP8EF64_9MICO
MIAGVAGIDATPERGVRAECQQRGQPDPNPVEGCHPFIGGLDTHVHVEAVRQLFGRRQPELLPDRPVPVAVGQVAAAASRVDRQRHDPRADGGGLIGDRPPGTDGRELLTDRALRR